MYIEKENDKRFMLNAIEKAKEGIKNGQTPFGACIVKENYIVACCHNQVWSGCDITAHAEVVAIREACKKLKSISLEGTVIYSTCEPCPMCFSACHWAKIDKIIFGASIKDARKAGFNELEISNKNMKISGVSPIIIEPHFLQEECIGLFEIWRDKGTNKLY